MVVFLSRLMGGKEELAGMGRGGKEEVGKRVDGIAARGCVVGWWEVGAVLWFHPMRGGVSAEGHSFS